MALTIQHVNADATFLITLALPRPSSPSPPPPREPSPALCILVDPWLHSDAPVFHPRFSNQLHTVLPAVSSLAELSPAPDLIVVSQSRSDHCHEATLRDFAWAKHPSTQLYACPDAVPVVRAWKWFPQLQLSVLKKGAPACVHIPNPQHPELRAWVELEHIPAKWLWEMPSLHSAVGIKYFFDEAPGNTKIISALFTPHGLPIAALRPWLSRLPGTTPRLGLLLHPFTHVHSYLGGDVSRGFPAGLEVCRIADVGTWVSAHDEETVVQGLVARWISETKWGCKKVERDLAAAGVGGVAVKELGVGEKLTVVDGVPVDA